MKPILIISPALVVILSLSPGRLFAKPGMTSETFNIPVDLTSLKQGDWVEHDWTWSSGKQFAKGTMRMACVRATDEEVWIEVCTDTAKGMMKLERVVRKTREVKSAWQRVRDGEPEKMEIFHPGAGPGRVPPPMEPVVPKSEGDSSKCEEELGSRKIAAEKCEFTCDVKAGDSTVHHRVLIVLSDEVPFARPKSKEHDPALIGDTIRSLVPKIAWKTTPKFTGGVVRSETSETGDPNYKVLRSEKLKGFGRDAKPTVVVDGETDEKSLK